MNRAIQTGFVCVLMALAVGCGAGGPSKTACVGEECLEGSDVQTFCTRDDQCPSDQYCAGGTCQPRSGGRPDDSCSTHNDCSVGRFCNILTGRCVDCLNQDHCDVGLVCRDDGTCGEDFGCTSNFDCGGLVCDTQTGNCVQCMSSADCPMGQTCRDQQCTTTGGSDPLCQSQTDCDPYGRICDMASGTCVPCVDDIECGAGKICSAGTCTIEGGGGGGGGGDGTCSSRDECTPQACSILLGMCMPCMMDFDCFDLMDLITGVSMICEPSTGNCIEPECSTANDCAPGEACYDGHCGTCLYNDECRTGEVCNTATGVCEEAGGGPTGCTDHTECPDWCDVGSGDCVQCLLNGHCPTDHECSGGICVPSSPTGCNGDGDCPGQYCQSTSGNCVDCLLAAHCGTGFTCQNNSCVPTSTGGGAFGDSCSGQTDCDGGLTCLGDGENGICSRTCIGSGNGGDADCPMGFACLDYETGALDGLKMCNSASELPSDFPGQPFDQAPGASCAAYNGCQTSFCFSSDQVCARGCSANRDCAGGEVCYATIDTSGDHMGYDFCFYSDTSSYTAAGGSCAENFECDSGLCEGECSDGSPCNGSNDCGGGACSGTCRDHCRSNADCAINESCNPWATQAAVGDGWVNVCLPKYFDGYQADGTTCSADGDCASDWCIQSTCTTPCAINADCTGALSGTVCDPITFVDSSQNPVYSLSFCL